MEIDERCSGCIGGLKEIEIEAGSCACGGSGKDRLDHILDAKHALHETDQVAAALVDGFAGETGLVDRQHDKEGVPLADISYEPGYGGGCRPPAVPSTLEDAAPHRLRAEVETEYGSGRARRGGIEDREVFVPFLGANQAARGNGLDVVVGDPVTDCLGLERIAVRSQDAGNPREILDGRQVGQKQAGEGLELPPADHAVGRLEQGTQAHQRLQLFVDAVLQQQRKVVGTLAQLQLGQLVLAMPDDGPGRDRQRKAHDRGRNADLDMTTALACHTAIGLHRVPTEDVLENPPHRRLGHAIFLSVACSPPHDCDRRTPNRL